MVDAVKPVIDADTFPEAVPFEVLLSAIVGFCDVDQQTPLAVIVENPVFVIFPPLVAEV